MADVRDDLDRHARIELLEQRAVLLGQEQLVAGARRLVLVLRNGLQVPVSKTYRDNIGEAGWLEK